MHLERYKQLAAYLTPHIGGTRLQDLTALTLERVFNHLKDAGGKDRKVKAKRPLSPKPVRHIAGVATVMLKKAVKLKLLKSNPMEGVELPSVPRHEARAIDSDKLD
jgi:site-specific recombinase XerC